LALATAVSEAWLVVALGEIDYAFDVLARAEEEYGDSRQFDDNQAEAGTSSAQSLGGRTRAPAQ